MMTLAIASHGNLLRDLRLYTECVEVSVGRILGYWMVCLLDDTPSTLSDFLSSSISVNNVLGP